MKAKLEEAEVLALLDDEHALDVVLNLMQRLAGNVSSDMAGTMVQEHLATGGKRLRARLALAAGRALGISTTYTHVWAAACELVHNATLVHDDIQDGDEKRRGQPTVWARHGVGQAINAGDLLFMLPFLALAELPTLTTLSSQLSYAIAERTACVIRGQAAEMAMLSRGDFSFAHYETVVLGKTSALFELPVLGTALMAGHSFDTAIQLASPFARLGLLFQIQDDLLDLYGDKGRSFLGGDLYEGKVSALVVAHMALHPEEAATLCELLKKPRHETNFAEVAHFIERFKEGGALQSVLSQVQEMKATQKNVPILTHTPLLGVLLEALTTRMLLPITHLLA